MPPIKKSHSFLKQSWKQAFSVYYFKMVDYCIKKLNLQNVLFQREGCNVEGVWDMRAKKLSFSSKHRTNLYW